MTTAITGTEALNNYIATQDASKAAVKAEKQESLWGDFNTFLTILTAQLQNQDPTDPADASEFTQQLIQYAQVEQQISTNTKLDSVNGNLNSNGITPLLSYVGQYVESRADSKLLVQAGTAKMAYSLPQEALSVAINVQDSSGDVIATIDGPTAKGLNRVMWDGVQSDGEQAAEGTYKFVLTAKDGSGEQIEVKDVRIIGQVSGIETNEDGAVELKMGSMSLSDVDVLSVFAAISASQ